MQNRSPQSQQNTAESIKTIQPSDRPLLSPWLSALGTGVLATSEAVLFYAPETVVKRLQNHYGSISSSNYRSIIFPGIEKGFMPRISSLYGGVGFAINYRVLQRAIKLAGQENIYRYFNSHLSENSKTNIGDVALRGVSGSFAGLLELILLPLDTVKTRVQTGTYTYTGLPNFINYVKQENIKLFNGTVITAIRNVKNAYIYFAGDAYIRKHVFKLENYDDATPQQKLISSTASVTTSTLVSLPLDVIKTRILSSSEKINTVPLIKNMVEKEGYSSFFKGGMTKIGFAVPKVVFTFCFVPYFASLLAEFIQKNVSPDLMSQSRFSLFANKAQSENLNNTNTLSSSKSSRYNP